MATIVNNPGTTDSGAGAAGWIVAAIVLVAAVLFALFVWPGFAGGAGAGNTNINVEVPTPDMGAAADAVTPQ